MKITFEVDDNFVEYFTDGGWSKEEVKKHCKNFIEKVLLEEVDDNNDLVFMSRFEDYFGEVIEE